MRKHSIVLALLISLSSAVLVWVFLKVQLTPAVASTQAQAIDKLFRILFAIGGVILALCLVTLIYVAVAFRRPQEDMEDGPPLQGHTALEMGWTLVPLAIVIALGIYGAVVLRDISPPPPRTELEVQGFAFRLEVRVTAFQWGWGFQYPQYGITSPELRLPVGRPVLLRLTSRDVIHSFWVPEFRVKQDAVPGKEFLLWVTPTKEGHYKVYCAELCGLAHALMAAPVTVMPVADFERWVKEAPR